MELLAVLVLLINQQFLMLLNQAYWTGLLPPYVKIVNIIFELTLFFAEFFNIFREAILIKRK